jgi:hypothetical protein
MGTTVWRCRHCGGELVMKKIVFEYLGHSLSHDLPVCASCGQTLITEALVEEKIKNVEVLLEDK